MVRSASPVTSTMHRPVPMPSTRWAASPTGSKSTPVARISRANTSPSRSSATVPTNAGRPPREATPASVLAADPPETSAEGVISAWMDSARARSTRDMDPFGSASASSSASEAHAMTSTSAEPTPTTSKRSPAVPSVTGTAARVPGPLIPVPRSY